jgi:hypothetical protein
MGLGLIRFVGAIVIVAGRIGFEMDLAVAAVAACAAFLAEMIRAGVLGTPDANEDGLFFADAAEKCHGCVH